MTDEQRPLGFDLVEAASRAIEQHEREKEQQQQREPKPVLHFPHG